MKGAAPALRLAFFALACARSSATIVPLIDDSPSVKAMQDWVHKAGGSAVRSAPPPLPPPPPRQCVLARCLSSLMMWEK